MPQSWDMGRNYFPSEGRHTEDFPDARKIQRFWPGLNPRTRVPVANMLTTRSPKPSLILVTSIVRCTKSSKPQKCKSKLLDIRFTSHPQTRQPDAPVGLARLLPAVSSPLFRFMYFWNTLWQYNSNTKYPQTPYITVTPRFKLGPHHNSGC